ncbi:MAG: 50S ribosomal protein L4 [Candidatus Binatia bacterium]
MDAQPLHIPVLSLNRETVGEIELPEHIAGQPTREHLLYETVRMQMANRRAGTASTKTRGEVRGGGKKPWRQKGTGRARAGSTRSPLWVGGAVIFGPRPRSYAYRMPKSARRTALCAALALKQRQGELIVVKELTLPEPKTKRMLEVLSGLGIGNSVLIVISQADDAIEKSAKNLPTVKVLRCEGLNVYDLLRYRQTLFTQQALELVSERLKP